VNALGDFQTPPALAAEMLAALHARGVRPACVIEPTCGRGAFLRAAAQTYDGAQQIIGVEWQAERYGPELAQIAASDRRITTHFADAYALDFAALAAGAGEVLVVGNPPWVTTAALGKLAAGAPQPRRSRDHGLRGLDARTGAANFDVAEFLALKLITDLQRRRFVLALLVKESVARKVVASALRRGMPLRAAEIVRIDARRWFGVAVDACCLIVHGGDDGAAPPKIAVRDAFEGAVVAWLAAGHDDDRAAVPAWRQGIKHDAASVFELRRAGTHWYNAAGERVDIEPEYVFPLWKARALHAGEAPADGLIVPQRRLGAPTGALAESAPKLHAYLSRHARRLAARKSSIYRNAPPYAIFGVGPYTFAPWKVAVAGFYAEPRFRVIGPLEERPVVFGDTAYFVPFADEAPARAFAARCTDPATAAAISTQVVRGKRPITKRLLDAVLPGA
jgi:hypothetical protein